MKTIFYPLSIIICFSSMQLSAQTGEEKRANQLYDNYAYADAAKAYGKIADKKKTASEESIRRAAYSNFILNNTQQAEVYYKKLVDLNKANATDYYNYAQAQKANGKYTEAEVSLQSYAALSTSEIRATEINSKKVSLDKIKNEPAYFELKSIEGNSKGSDFSPAFYKDVVLFSSNRNAKLYNNTLHSYNNESFLDLMQAKPDANNNLTEIKKFSKSLSTKFHEGTVVFNKAGDVVYFTRNNYDHKTTIKSNNGVNNLQLYKATLKNDEWVEEKLPFNDKEFSCGHPALSADESVLYFTSDMPNGKGGTDIYKINLNKDGSVSGTPENLGTTINTEGNEMFPVINGDLLYFSSNGHVGFGQLDVFVSKPNSQGQFKKIVNVGAPINTGNDDFSLVLANNQTGYMASNRNGGKGEDDIYFVKQLRPLKFSYIIKGVVVESETGKPLPNSSVKLNTGELLTTDAKGAYEFEAEDDKIYELVASKKDYYDAKGTIDTHIVPKDGSTYTQDFAIDKDPGLALKGTIVDLKTNSPVIGVLVIVKDNVTGKELLKTTTDNTGILFKSLADNKVGDKLDYTIIYKKEGYVTKTVTLVTDIKQPGEITFTEKLGKPEVGMDLAKMVEIKPIYFDLGKATVRKDAALELDKIVQIMKDYPGMVVELGSHTDCRGTAAANTKLSDKRAKASAAYVVSKGITNIRIYGKGYGEEKLVNACACEGKVKPTCSETEHQANRRTEFIIVKILD